MSNMIWLYDVLKTAGLDVHETQGWKTRGRAEMGDAKAVICHHTASAIGTSKWKELSLVTNGRPGLSGPLCHLFLSRDAVFYCVAAGVANHAGKGGWNGLVGNSQVIGIEADNDGLKEPWPKAQTEAYAKGVAALLKRLNLTNSACIGHKEWAPKRKPDPSFDMNIFRNNVLNYMKVI